MENVTFDSLKDFPRVPRTDGSGIQLGVGGIPPNKKAISYGKPVDYMEAASNMNKRLRGELPPIPGGIDDNDPALYDHPSSNSPYNKMHVAQHGALTEEQVELLKMKVGDGPAPEQGGPVSSVDATASEAVRTEPVPVRTESVPVVSEEVAVEAPSVKQGARKRRSQVVEKVVEKPVYVTKEVPVYKEVEKVVEKEVVKPGPFEEWSKRRTRVQIGTTETTFNVSAVAVVRSLYGITVILPTNNDSMTFVPRTGAHVRIGVKDSVSDTIYTGVSFDIEELGIMGLCFIVDKKKESTETA